MALQVADYVGKLQLVSCCRLPITWSYADCPLFFVAVRVAKEQRWNHPQSVVIMPRRGLALRRGDHSARG